MHIGACDVAAIDGPVSDISAHLAHDADPHGVNVSRTVADLLPGSGVPFVDRGTRQLGGEARPLGVLAVSTEPHPD